MKLGRAKFRSILACVAFLFTLGTNETAFTADAVESCALPKTNMREAPHVADGLTSVEVGLLLIDIIEIDDVKQQFTADFMVIQTWADPRLDGLAGCRYDLSQVWSPELTFINSSRVFPKFSAYVAVESEGNANYFQRYRGSLSFRHGLHDFPFDSHTISIAMMPAGPDADRYELIVNQNQISRLPDFTILDWTFGDVLGRINPAIRPISQDAVNVFTFEIPATRLYQYYLWKVLMPLVLIVAMSWSVFWINPAKFGPQIGMSATSMLTLIAFQFAMASILPHLSYFTLLDRFITAATGLVFLALVQSLTTSYLVSVDRATLAMQMDRICRWVFPLGFVVMVLLIFRF